MTMCATVNGLLSAVQYLEFRGTDNKHSIQLCHYKGWVYFKQWSGGYSLE